MLLTEGKGGGTKEGTNGLGCSRKRGESGET